MGRLFLFHDRIFTQALGVGAALLLLAGCDRSVPKTAADSVLIVTTVPDTGAAMAPPVDSTARPSLPMSAIRVEVDLKARQLHLYRGDAMIATHPVAVGSAEWPTRTGDWNILQVVWNPEWIPPDESWAEERKARKPGDPANPLGQAQLVYDPPRTIHGTTNPSSVGKAVSHGSIRVTNEVAKQLARMLMEETGAGKDEAWYKATQDNRSIKQIVDLPQLVPIRVF